MCRGGEGRGVGVSVQRRGVAAGDRGQMVKDLSGVRVSSSRHSDAVERLSWQIHVVASLF